MRRAGLDPDAFLEVASGSAGQLDRPGLEGPPDVRRELRAALLAGAHAQDVRHCLAEAEALGVELRLGTLAEGLYARAAEQGHGEDDFAAVVTVVDSPG